MRHFAHVTRNENDIEVTVYDVSPDASPVVRMRMRMDPVLATYVLSTLNDALDLFSAVTVDDPQLATKLSRLGLPVRDGGEVCCDRLVAE